MSAAQQFTIWILPVIFALLLGDRTAKIAGRVSLNPIRHIDPVGTVLLPGMALLLHAPMFGWAKPVPINFHNLGHPRRDTVLVALAGPGMNVLLATVSMALLPVAVHLPAVVAGWAFGTLRASLYLNLILAVFNMLPIPPLDGGRVAVGVLPRALAEPLARLEPYGLMIVMGLFLLLPLALTGHSQAFNPYAWLVQGPALWLAEHMAMLFGIG
jgi:Zn-dependent protease